MRNISLPFMVSRMLSTPVPMQRTSRLSRSVYLRGRSTEPYAFDHPMGILTIFSERHISWSQKLQYFYRASVVRFYYNLVRTRQSLACHNTRMHCSPRYSSSSFWPCSVSCFSSIISRSTLTMTVVRASKTYHYRSPRCVFMSASGELSSKRFVK